MLCNNAVIRAIMQCSTCSRNVECRGILYMGPNFLTQPDPDRRRLQDKRPMDKRPLIIATHPFHTTVSFSVTAIIRTASPPAKILLANCPETVTLKSAVGSCIICTYDAKRHVIKCENFIFIQGIGLLCIGLLTEWPSVRWPFVRLAFCLDPTEDSSAAQH